MCIHIMQMYTIKLNVEKASYCRTYFIQICVVSKNDFTKKGNGLYRFHMYL